MPRIARSLFAAALALAMTVAALFLGLELLHAISQPRLIPLTAGFPRYANLAGVAFDARLKKAFLLGSPETAMVEALMRQGFKPSPGWGPSGTHYLTRRDGDDFACR